MTEEEYFDEIHTDNKETLYNALKRIEELELELTVEKDQHQEEINLHLHAEDYIKSLEKEIKELKHNKKTVVHLADRLEKIGLTKSQRVYFTEKIKGR